MTRVTGERRVPFRKRRSGFLHHALSADRTAELVRRCREEDATVHGALSAALVTAAVQHRDGLLEPGYDRDEGLRITLGSPVDMRQSLEPRVGADEAGAFVSIIRTPVDYHEAMDFWHIARSVTDDMRTRQRRGEAFSELHFSRMAMPRTLRRSRPIVNSLEKAGPQNLILSNIGRFDFPASAGRLSFSGAQFAASNGASCYIGATVNTSHGRMSLNVNYLREAIPDQVAEGFAAEWARLLTAVSTDGARAATDPAAEG